MKTFIAILFGVLFAFTVHAKPINLHAEWEAIDDDKVGFTLFFVLPNGETTVAVTNIDPASRTLDFSFDLPMGHTQWVIQADYDDEVRVDMNYSVLFKHRGGPPRIIRISE